MDSSPKSPVSTSPRPAITLEELWFARVVMLFGVKELVDAFVNLIALLKIRSNLPIVPANVDSKLVLTYLIVSLMVGGYLLAGGGLLSRLAYGRRAPRPPIDREVPLPAWPDLLALGFRSFGVYQMIQAIGGVALAIAYYSSPSVVREPAAHPIHLTYAAWAIECALIGFVLLAGGGRLARFFIGGGQRARAEHH